MNFNIPGPFRLPLAGNGILAFSGKINDRLDRFAFGDNNGFSGENLPGWAMMLFTLCEVPKPEDEERTIKIISKVPENTVCIKKIRTEPKEIYYF